MVSRKSGIHLGFAALLLLTYSPQGFASGLGISPIVTSQAREATAQKFINQALQVWQARLNLKNWNIHVQLVHPDELEPKTLGNIHWDSNNKHATIDVLSSYDYTLPTPAMLNDMEMTVVHELVHLHLAALPRTDATRRNEEYVVNQISRALLNLSKHE